MRLLYRYILCSALGAVIGAIALFVFVLLAGNALRDVIGLLAGGRLSIGLFFELLLLLLPYVIAYALPLGTLTGVLIVLGRLSAQQEITAMKAAGFGLKHIAAPILFIALLGVWFTLLVNSYYAPQARKQYRSILAQVVRDNPLNFFQPRTFITEFPGYILYISERRGQDMHHFWIWELDQAQRVRVFIRAGQGRFAYNPQEDAIILTLYNGVAEKRNDTDPEDVQDTQLLALTFDELSIQLSLERILGNITQRKRLSMLTLDELIEAQGRARTLLATTRSASKSVPIPKDHPASETLDTDEAYRQLIRIQFQIQKNLSMSFSVLSLVLLGIPLGLKISRKESYANFAIALVLALAFYMLIIMATWLEKYPDLRPDLCVWVPNLLFQGVGLYFISRAHQH